ncbi:MAG: GatB/YqeY domain-containing protein [Patescibacteria group bacterium]
MTIKETITKDLKEAMKAKEVEKRDTLRTLDSMIKNEEIEQGKREDGLDDASVVVLVKRAIKQRKDSATQFKAGGREELAQKEELEISFIEKYLPAQMSEDDVRAVVEKVVKETGATGKADMGKVMGGVMKEIGDSADGAVVRSVVEESLS